ncbi:indoleacetate decarboxylase activase [Clostridium sp. A1-XYC3]|uniref:Indoleacetate decarboxylase activase n=1 Tax=Clostridium tanneri TaxID=3037988 RepID=A0ABU4JUC7_9CLOT|nr:indoleacetate decarboxylase activase [Clostridium sp. A1-XYC3]MDW8801746.1 indoleacetate decarboxylase activase [Clostridium sp. A1-XYC3]
MKNLRSSGIIFDIQSLSFHDGPGIRTLVFLKGCPLKCLWCANPEGQKLLPELRYHKVNCAGCMECSKACVENAITLKNHEDAKVTISINKEKCIKCSDLKCTDMCLNDALKLSGKTMTVDEVMKVIKRDSAYYKRKGGVTLSGGDPTYQPEFAVSLLKACKEEYINTAVESAMFTTVDTVNKFIPVTDLFLTDIKHMNEDKHKKLTGVSNQPILNNISIISKQKPVVIRVPIIPGLNDDKENIISISRFCAENNIDRINLLPYHKLGVAKYEQLGLTYDILDVNSPNKEKMELLKEAVESSGVKCIIG